MRYGLNKKKDKWRKQVYLPVPVPMSDRQYAVSE